MILAANRSKGGFTLLEVIVALVLMALLLAIALVSWTPDSSGERLQKTEVEVEALAARGLTMAVLHQMPFWLVIEKDRILLQGGEIAQERNNGAIDFNGLEEESIGSVNAVVTYDQIDINCDLFVRRWGAREKEWGRQADAQDEPIIWRFGSSGLCEPLSLRLELEDSWIELEMDPLTAMVSDKQSELY